MDIGLFLLASVLFMTGTTASNYRCNGNRHRITMRRPRAIRTSSRTGSDYGIRATDIFQTVHYTLLSCNNILNRKFKLSERCR